MKTGFRVSISRTAMAGVQGGMSYDVLVPVECVPNYDGSRYITICSDERRFVDFIDATLPESHFQMPKGIERYRDYQLHKLEARRAAFNIAAAVFPELEKTREQEHGLLPFLWVFGLLDIESSAEITVNCHEYACGCYAVTAEDSHYYDHACATCHRERGAVRRD
jgi:hypothetical protein